MFVGKTILSQYNCVGPRPIFMCFCVFSVFFDGESKYTTSAVLITEFMMLFEDCG